LLFGKEQFIFISKILNYHRQWAIMTKKKLDDSRNMGATTLGKTTLGLTVKQWRSVKHNSYAE